MIDFKQLILDLFTFGIYGAIKNQRKILEFKKIKKI